MSFINKRYLLTIIILTFLFTFHVFNGVAVAAVGEVAATEALDLSEVALNKRGYGYLSKGEFGKAIADFTEALKLNRGLNAARVNRGYAYYGAGNYKKAVRDFSKALKLDPESAEAATALNGRALAYFKLDKSSKAVVDLDKVLGIDPWFEDALYNRASVYYKNAKFTQAAGDYSKLIQMKPTDILALMGRANSNRESGDYNRALTDYTRAINLYPEKAAVFHERGVAFHRKGLFDRALSDYKRALELGLKSGALYYDLGLTLYKGGDLRGAVSALTRAIKLNPLYQPPQNTGDNKAGARGPDEVNKGERAALKSAYFQRGVALKAARIFNAAVKDFTKVIELDPKDAEALNNRGYLYLVELEQTEKGCADLKAACTLGECANFNIAKENEMCE